MLPYGKLICNVIHHTAAGNMLGETGIRTVVLQQLGRTDDCFPWQRFAGQPPHF